MLTKCNCHLGDWSTKCNCAQLARVTKISHQSSIGSIFIIINISINNQPSSPSSVTPAWHTKVFNQSSSRPPHLQALRYHGGKIILEALPFGSVQFLNCFICFKANESLSPKWDKLQNEYKQYERKKYDKNK